MMKIVRALSSRRHIRSATIGGARCRGAARCVGLDSRIIDHGG